MKFGHALLSSFFKFCINTLAVKDTAATEPKQPSADRVDKTAVVSWISRGDEPTEEDSLAKRAAEISFQRLLTHHNTRATFFFLFLMTIFSQDKTPQLVGDIRQV